jgi:hypothetical protein
MKILDLTRINVTKGGTTQHYPIESWKGSITHKAFSVPASQIGEFERVTLDSDNGGIPATHIKINGNWTHVVETPTYIKRRLAGL